MRRRSATRRVVHILLTAGMIGIVFGLPLVSLALGGNAALVVMNEAKDATDGKCDGLEIEFSAALAVDWSVDLTPPLVAPHSTDTSAIDTPAVFAGDHLQRGPPRQLRA